VQVADAEVLLYNISGFRNYLISLYFIFSEFGRGRIFAHNTISDFISSQEVSIGFSSPG